MRNLDDSDFGNDFMANCAHQIRRLRLENGSWISSIPSDDQALQMIFFRGSIGISRKNKKV